MKALRCGAAALIDEAGPTASHGGSFVHQGQSHPGEHSPIIDFAATTRFTAPAYWEFESIFLQRINPRESNLSPSRTKSDGERSCHCWCGKQVTSTGGPTGAKGPVGVT